MALLLHKKTAAKPQLFFYVTYRLVVAKQPFSLLQRLQSNL